MAEESYYTPPDPKIQIFDFLIGFWRVGVVPCRPGPSGIDFASINAQNGGMTSIPEIFLTFRWVGRSDPNSQLFSIKSIPYGLSGQSAL